MNITTFLILGKDEDDDELLDKDAIAQALGKPGKPISHRSVGRLWNQPDGLSYIQSGNCKYSRRGAVRELLRRRERHPNTRRRRDAT